MATMQKTPVPMTKSSAVALTFLYALGYPIGALSVSAMTPMLVLVARFALAGAILATWALIARAVWPTGRTLCHVIVAGLLMQAVQFCALYEALEHGAPAVLGAVVISMNPVVTAVLAALFLDERLNRWRLVALALGVVAVLAACANRLLATGGIDTVLVLLLVALLGLAAGGVYQQRFCADVDFRVNSTIQNLSGLLPAGALALLTPAPSTILGRCRCRGRGSAAQRHAVHLAVRAFGQHIRRGRSCDAVLRHSGRRRPVVLAPARPACRHRHGGRTGHRRSRLLAQCPGKPIHQIGCETPEPLNRGGDRRAYP